MVGDSELLAEFDRCLQSAADELHSLSENVFWTRQDLLQRPLGICWSEPSLVLALQGSHRTLKTPIVHADVSGVDVGLLSGKAIGTERTPSGYIASLPETLRPNLSCWKSNNLQQTADCQLVTATC